MREIDQELFDAAGQGNLSEVKKCLNNPNYGLSNKERHRNRGLFRLHGIGNQDRKNMN